MAAKVASQNICKNALRVKSLSHCLALNKNFLVPKYNRKSNSYREFVVSANAASSELSESPTEKPQKKRKEGKPGNSKSLDRSSTETLSTGEEIRAGRIKKVMVKLRWNERF